MSVINPISPVFTGSQGKTAKSELKKIKTIMPKKLTPEQVLLEKALGAQYALTHDAEEIKYRAMNEILLGNMDFVDGMKEALAIYSALNSYK